MKWIVPLEYQGALTKLAEALLAEAVALREAGDLVGAVGRLRMRSWLKQTDSVH